MTDRPKFLDDLAGVAGGAMSALAGLREEAESTLRARVEDVIRKLDLVRREDLEAVQEMAANARSAQAALETRLAVLESRLGETTHGAASSSAASSGVASSGLASSGAASSSAAASAPPVLPATPVAPRPADDAAAEGSPS